jgi:predicted RNA-binding protein with PUA-like domain
LGVTFGSLSFIPLNAYWQTVIVEFVESFDQPILLSTLKQEFSPEELMVVRPGNRLSVIPVPEAVAMRIMAMKTQTS